MVAAGVVAAATFLPPERAVDTAGAVVAAGVAKYKIISKKCEKKS